MKTLVTFLFMLFLTNFITAQPYVDGGKTRHRFAQMTLGIDNRFFSNNNTETFSFSESGFVQSSKLGELNEYRMIIGGTHFWGHADFFVAFPFTSFSNSGFRSGVETGMKIFPWRIENKKLRPYLGLSWLPTSYQQEKGAIQTKHQSPLTGGLVYNRKKLLFDLGGGFFLKNQRNYFINPEKSVNIKTHSFFLNFSVKFIFDATLSAEKDWQIGRTKLLTDTLAKLKRLHGFTLAIGPSSAIFLKSSEYNKETAPYLEQHKFGNLFPEFGIGYYFHQPDLQLNLAYRSIHSRQKAYEHEQHLHRKALTFEAYKFLGDYHGFVPFAGPALSYESLSANESRPNTNDVSTTFEGLKPGITFGWDIRPNRLQIWYLRTNLRYFPNLFVKHPKGQKISFDQLEFNFIQLVIYPQRFF
jgi:hypothetical protein